MDDQSLAVLNIFSKFSEYWLNRRQINLNRTKKCFFIWIWRKIGDLNMQNLKKYLNKAYKKKIGNGDLNMQNLQK